MCGIFAVHSLPNPAADRSRFIALSKRQRHRGPDWSGCYVGQRTVLVHERLAVVGVGEPFPASDIVLIADFLVQIPARSLSVAKTGSKFWPLMARSTITSNYELLVTQVTNSRRTLTARSSFPWYVRAYISFSCLL